MPVGSMVVSAMRVERADVRHGDGPLDAGVVAADVEGHAVELDVGEGVVAAVELVDQLVERLGGQGRRPHVDVGGAQRRQGVVVVFDGGVQGAHQGLGSRLVGGHRASSFAFNVANSVSVSTTGSVEVTEALQVVQRVALGGGHRWGDAPGGVELGLQLPVVGGLLGAVAAAGCRASTSEGAGTGTTRRGPWSATRRGSWPSAPRTRRR